MISPTLTIPVGTRLLCVFTTFYQENTNYA